VKRRRSTPRTRVAIQFDSRVPQLDPAMIGRIILHYEIVETLGHGGMGVVYKARDTHLDRFIAIKVLPPEKVADAERKRRFVQEAKAASALNHPNIVHIYDIAEANEIQFIAMEYVAGKTLDQLIGRKGLRLNEVLKYAVQIADALAQAHAAGIIHRDLKPSNIMVTENGIVKVLDFGLAKLSETATGEFGETATVRAPEGPSTEEGAIVGTVAYMSPEQAEGKKVDARSDIFSFGSVLYEVITGRRAFHGDSKLSTLSAILKDDPKPVSGIMPDVPRDLEKIISRCLRKDAERRYQHMADVKVALGELQEESESGTLAGPASARASRRPLVWVGVGLVILSIFIGTWLFRGAKRTPPAAVDVVPLTSYAGFENSPSFSPDGNQVVFSWNGENQDNFDIYVKLIDSPTQLRLTTDPAPDVSPVLSPDGRSIGFVRASKERSFFMIIPALGGPERTVGEISLPYRGAESTSRAFDWFPGGKWIVTVGLMLMSTESGDTRSLTSPPMKSPPDFSPAVSPDGRAVAFARASSFGISEIYVLDLTEDLKPSGPPRRLTSMKRSSDGPVWTSNGRDIIFTSEVFASKMSLWRVSASAGTEPEQLQFTSGQDSFWPAISRSGNRMAYTKFAFDSNIWRLSLSGTGAATGPATRLIASTALDSSPQYSPDGKRIAFESSRSGVHGIWVSNADGSNPVELFSRSKNSCGTPRWSPDGQRIAFDCVGEAQAGINVIRATGGKPTRATADSVDDVAPSWSRDGKWVYFTSSHRTGRSELWKAPANGGQSVQVTRNAGGPAFESPDGQTVYYQKGDFSGSLWKMRTNGGEESPVLPSVASRAFSIVNDGIYFISMPEAGQNASLQFLSFATQKVKTIAPLLRPLDEGLAVSPDGRFILFSQSDEAGSDLMLVENFR
jgi:eukaryotic-like serine/threonine-protein kinase